mmetsp:Transcript_19704/g.49007  ORF Transcript_19704/g.49007 Transcript_19704/m.49007 type:complete len:248 (+) Transcript_19704:558-1301(+)
MVLISWASVDFSASYFFCSFPNSSWRSRINFSSNSIFDTKVFLEFSNSSFSLSNPLWSSSNLACCNLICFCRFIISSDIKAFSVSIDASLSFNIFAFSCNESSSFFSTFSNCSWDSAHLALVSTNFFSSSLILLSSSCLVTSNDLPFSSNLSCKALTCMRSLVTSSCRSRRSFSKFICSYSKASSAFSNSLRISPVASFSFSKASVFAFKSASKDSMVFSSSACFTMSASEGPLSPFSRASSNSLSL